jgi:dynein heavy chain
VESEPKQLYVPLPVLFVTANLKEEERKSRREQFGQHGPYECPCYKYRARTDRYLIFNVNLRCTSDRNPSFWTLRGAALLCNIDS